MNSGRRLFLGIDVGTGGARAVAVAEDGVVVAAATAAFDPAILVQPPDRHEQPPEAWWKAVVEAVTAVVNELVKRSASIGWRMTAVAVAGTSGTLVALDRAGGALRPAMMYNDPRAAAVADDLNRFAADFCHNLGYRFNASCALAKIAWLQKHEPDVFSKTARFVHQADYVVERLTGRPAPSDYSNALKTGYDLVDHRWPAWIDLHLGVESKLPRVVAPGVPIGEVSPAAADATGLPAGLIVVAGATDGTAAFLASGGGRVGDYNTTLGTTLVFKGMSPRLCRHTDGLIYCHKLPGGWWLPGAASNVGTNWIAAMFPGVDVRGMDAAAAARLPINGIAYPLFHAGERFPFSAPDARGFCIPQFADPFDGYAAHLQGVALVERLGYQVLDAATNASGGEVFATGGGSRSDVWTQCRADATGRVFHRPVCG